MRGMRRVQQLTTRSNGEHTGPGAPTAASAGVIATTRATGSGTAHNNATPNGEHPHGSAPAGERQADRLARRSRQRNPGAGDLPVRGTNPHRAGMTPMPRSVQVFRQVWER
ncbi:hypothetical protein JCM33774_20310 [Actinophytocola sp. KF-1]